mgnify:FL=1
MLIDELGDRLADGDVEALGEVDRLILVETDAEIELDRLPEGLADELGEREGEIEEEGGTISKGDGTTLRTLPS